MTGPATPEHAEPEGGAQKLVEELRRRRLTVGVAESLTGGLLAAALVDVAGASAVVRGGIVAYASDLKATLLGVDGRLLSERGAVDPTVAQQMAEGVRRAVGERGVPADVGLSTTGVAGPDPSDGREVGTVFVAVSAAESTRVEEFRFLGDRASIRRQSVVAAIALAIEVLDTFGDAVSATSRTTE